MNHSRISIALAFVLAVSFVSLSRAAQPTPTIHQAAQAGDLEAVKTFLDAGTAPDVTDANQCTPLFYAVKAGAAPVVELLLQKGANPDQPGAGGQTPRAMAEANVLRYAQVAALLRVPVATATNMPPMRGRRGGMPGMPPMNANPQPEPAAAPAPQGATTDANEAIVAILADPNRVLAKVAEIADVNLKPIEDKGRGEERAWQLRTTDNRATLVRTIEGVFNEDLALIKKIADGEKAAKTSKAVDTLKAKRQKRYAAIYDEMRSARQTAAASNTGTTGTRGRGATTGGGGRGNRGMNMNEQEPAATTRLTTTRRSTIDPNVDPVYEGQSQAWSSSNYEDKRDLLKVVHELDVKELYALDEIARGEKADKTAATIEALMVLRQQRITRIGEAMAKEDQRLERVGQRTPAATTGGRNSGRGGNTATRTNTGRGSR